MTRIRPEILFAACGMALLLICPALAAAPSPVPEQGEPPVSAGSETEGGGLLAGAAAGGGTAVLIGAGAYTFVRKKVSEEKEKPREFVHYENHTREGTLTPEERRDRSG